MWFVGKIFFDLLCRFWRGWSSAAPWWTATHRWGTETHTTSLGLELGTGGAKFRVQNSWLKHVYSTGPSSKGFSPLSLFFKQSVTSVALRWPSSASSWGRWTTWRRSKLFRNRTGGTQLQKHHSHGSSLHFFFFNLCLWLFFSHDAMDSFYDYIWDVTILEYLTCILTLPGL